MGYGLQVTAPIEAGRNVAAYLLTGLSYIDPECAEPVVYSCDLPLVEACGPAVASWMRAAHQCPLDIHNTRVGMNSSEFHESIGMVRVCHALHTPVPATATTARRGRAPRVRGARGAPRPAGARRRASQRRSSARTSCHTR